MTTCVLSHRGGHWLLSDVVNCSITLCLRMREKNLIQPAFDLLLDDDGRVTLELFLLASNIKKKVARIFYSFLTFLKSYEERKKKLKV